MQTTLDEEQAIDQLEKGYVDAEKILKDTDKLERFLQRLEKKLKTIPLAGEKLSHIPVMVSLVKSYAKKEYTDIPIGTIIAVISALVYFLSPFDLVPDSVPILGYFDDAAVVAACWALVESDISEYIKWREVNGKVLDV
ncbi:MAG: DUF1232 domain-containing protein [Oscillospiraceae bacterium]